MVELLQLTLDAVLLAQVVDDVLGADFNHGNDNRLRQARLQEAASKPGCGRTPHLNTKSVVSQQRVLTELHRTNTDSPTSLQHTPHDLSRTKWIPADAGMTEVVLAARAKNDQLLLIVGLVFTAKRCERLADYKQ